MVICLRSPKIPLLLCLSNQTQAPLHHPTPFYYTTRTHFIFFSFIPSTPQIIPQIGNVPDGHQFCILAAEFSPSNSNTTFLMFFFIHIFNCKNLPQLGNAPNGPSPQLAAGVDDSAAESSEEAAAAAAQSSGAAVRAFPRPQSLLLSPLMCLTQYNK